MFHLLEAHLNPRDNSVEREPPPRGGPERISRTFRGLPWRVLNDETQEKFRAHSLYMSEL